MAPLQAAVGAVLALTVASTTTFAQPPGATSCSQAFLDGVFQTDSIDKTTAYGGCFQNNTAPLFAEDFGGQTFATLFVATTEGGSISSAIAPVANVIFNSTANLLSQGYTGGVCLINSTDSVPEILNELVAGTPNKCTTSWDIITIEGVVPGLNSTYNAIVDTILFNVLIELFPRVTPCFPSSCYNVLQSVCQNPANLSSSTFIASLQTIALQPGISAGTSAGSYFASPPPIPTGVFSGPTGVAAQLSTQFTSNGLTVPGATISLNCTTLVGTQAQVGSGIPPSAGGTKGSTASALARVGGVAAAVFAIVAAGVAA